jgi:hypothetical protein
MTINTITANDALNEALKAEAIYHQSQSLEKCWAFDQMQHWMDLACELEQKENECV